MEQKTSYGTTEHFGTNSGAFLGLEISPNRASYLVTIKDVLFVFSSLCELLENLGTIVSCVANNKFVQFQQLLRKTY